MRIQILESGSKGNAFLLENKDTLLMVDCGGTKRYLQEAFEQVGKTFEEINTLLITHNHVDHIGQIKSFTHANIYSPIEIKDVDVNEVIPYQSFTVGSITITPLALSHDAENTVGYVFESEGEKFCSITDTGYVSDKNREYMRESDYILLEANHDIEMLMETQRPQYVKSRIYSDMGHLNNEDCADVLLDVLSKKTKAVILGHISQEANTEEMAYETIMNEIESKKDALNPELVVTVAKQYEIIVVGEI